MNEPAPVSARDALAAAVARLAHAGVPSPRHDAEALLAWVLGTPVGRVDVAAGRQPVPVEATADGFAPTADQLAAFEAVVSRRAGREPLQHITGLAGFRYLELEVGPGVFVPRPETEVMTGVAVDELARLVAGGLEAPVAVDLCTGSAAVALSLATEVPGTHVTAVELSPEAAAYARRNVARQASGCPIDVRQGDIASAVDDLTGEAHVVTANPPYLPLEAFETVDPEARQFEPPLALWSGPDGLATVAVVAEVAARLLVDGGLVVCEHADVQGDLAMAVFRRQGCWDAVVDHHDLTRRPRFVAARRVARDRLRAGTIEP